MKIDALMDGLKEVAQQIGVTVRSENGKFTGGFCVLRDKRMIVVNRKMPTEAKVAVLARSLAEFPLDEVYIKPAIREYIEDEKFKADTHERQRMSQAAARRPVFDKAA